MVQAVAKRITQIQSNFCDRCLTIRYVENPDGCACQRPKKPQQPMMAAPVKLPIGRRAVERTVGGTCSQSASSRYLQSFGAMSVTLKFLSEIAQIKLQALNKWTYKVAISRVQKRVPNKARVFVFTAMQAYLLDDRGGVRRMVGKQGGVSHAGWISCHVSRRVLFQVTDGDKKFRLLHVDANEASCSVAREGLLDRKRQGPCLASFIDMFVLLISGRSTRGVARYSIATNQWEELPPLKVARAGASACILGNSAYAFCGEARFPLNSIEILRNPGALNPHDVSPWRLINVPERVLPTQYGAIAIPISASQIAIFGGVSKNQTPLVSLFDTRKEECRRKLLSPSCKFYSVENQAFRFARNTITALVRDPTYRLQVIEYRLNAHNVKIVHEF